MEVSSYNADASLARNVASSHRTLAGAGLRLTAGPNRAMPDWQHPLPSRKGCR